MAKIFNVNTSEVVAYTNRLEKIHRSAMPVAVRGALNDAADDMKKNQVEKAFDNEFTTRKKNFIKSHTAVNKSKNTFNLRDMKSETGVIKGKSTAGDQLEIQEIGGNLSGRAPIVTDEARISKNEKKLVSRKFFLKNLKGKGVISKNKNKRIFASKNSIIQNVKGEKRFKVLYRFRNSRKYEKSPFIEPAGIRSSKKIPGFFIERAIKKINSLK